MATQITVDLITDDEREVASILKDLTNLILSRERAHETTDPREPTSHVLPNKKKAEPTSPVTPLCSPKNSNKELLVAPSSKPLKKRKPKKDRLMEKKDEVAVLKKEKENLIREFLELQEKCRSAKAMNFYLKDKKSKLSALNQFKPEDISKPTVRGSLNFIIKLVPSSQPSVVQPAIKRPKGEFNLNTVAAPLTCDQFYREEKAAKSAQARKRRLEILQGKRTSPALKRPRVSDQDKDGTILHMAMY